MLHKFTLYTRPRVSPGFVKIIPYLSNPHFNGSSVTWHDRMPDLREVQASSVCSCALSYVVNICIFVILLMSLCVLSKMCIN